MARGFSRNLLVFAAVVALAAGLAACSSGGGSPPGGYPSTVPTTVPSSSPSSLPGYAGQRPAAVGDRFTFAGTLSESNVFNYPSPSPLPATTTAATVSQVVTVVASPYPYAAPSPVPVDFQTVETDTYPLRTSTLTSNAWYGYTVTPIGLDFVLWGWTSSDSATPPDTYAYAYATPQIFDELPEIGGASWTNSPAVTITENDSDGTSSTRIYSAGGTYTESTVQLAGNIKSSIVENADGSGTYSSNNFIGLSGAAGGQIVSITYSAPSPVPSASPQITVSLNYATPPPPTPVPSASPGAPTPTPAPTTPPIVLSVPQWYATPPAFYTETDAEGLGVAFPASCNVPSAYGTSGTRITQNVDRLDTILGYTDQQQTQAYVVQGFGPVCVVMTDLQTTYYDYLGDQLALLSFSNAPQSTSTIAETLTLQPGAVVNAIGRRSEGANGAQSSARAITPQMFAAARARFLTAVDRERRSRERLMMRFYRRILNRRNGGFVR